MTTRGVHSTVAALLLVYLGLRVLLAVQAPYHLFEAEEFIALAARRQVALGLPLGNLVEGYWYGPVLSPALGGGGPLVQALLIAALPDALGQGHLALRSSAVLWSLAGWGAVAMVAVRVFGRRRGLIGAALAAVAAPPATVLHSLTAHGNYVEGGVLALALLGWADVLRARGRSRPAVPFLFGAAAVGVAWFCPLYLPVAGVALLLFASARPPLGSWASGALGILAVAAIAVATLPTPESPGAAPLQAARTLLAWSPEVFLDSAWRTFGGTPAYGVLWDGRPTLPLVAQRLLEPTYAVFATVALVVLLVPRGRERAGLGPWLVVVALGLPLAMAATATGVSGAGPHWEPRRTYLIALIRWVALSGLLGALWWVPRRLRIPARSVAVLLVCAMAAPTAALALGRRGPPLPHVDLLLCPAPEPRHAWPGLWSLGPMDPPMLGRLLGPEPLRTLDPGERCALLEGYSSTSVADQKILRAHPGRCAPSMGAEQFARWEGPAPWRGAGAGLAARCPEEVRDAFCAHAPDAAARELCLDPFGERG